MQYPERENQEEEKKGENLSREPEVDSAPVYVSGDEKANANAELSKKTSGVLKFFSRLLLVLLTLGAVLLSGFLVWLKLTRPVSVAKYLPSETTIALVELDIDGNSRQVQDFFQLFRRYPEYQKPALFKQFNEIFTLDIEKEIKPWIGRKASLALLMDAAGGKKITPLLFLESRDDEKAKIFLQRYSSDASDMTGMLMDHLVVLGGNKEVLRQVDGKNASSEPKLRDNPDYRKVEESLPQGNLVFAYVSFPKGKKVILETPEISQSGAEVIENFEPFLSWYQSGGAVVAPGQKHLDIQTFASVDRTRFNGQKFFTQSEKYQGALLHLADENPTFLFAGHDLANEIMQWDHLLQAKSTREYQGNAGEGMISGMLEPLKENFFGPELSLQNDVFPLLRKEYLLEIDQGLDRQSITLMVEMNDEEKDPARLKKIMDAFVSHAGIFDPRIREFTLPDGTKGREMVASDLQGTQSKSFVEDTPVITLSFENIEWNIHYALSGKIVIISTDRLKVLDAIRRNREPRSFFGSTPKIRSLGTSTLYRQNFEPILRSADEVFHAKISPATGLLGLDKNPIVKAWLDPFLSLTVTNNFFDDGVASWYILNVY